MTNEYIASPKHEYNCANVAGNVAERTKLPGNARSTELIAFCSTAQARYATTDARKHADYVVTDTPALPAAPGPPQA